MTIVAITSAQLKDIVPDSYQLPKTFSTHPPGDTYSINTLDTNSIPVTGKMVTAQYAESVLDKLKYDEIKRKLVKELVDLVMKENCIEFTYRDDVSTNVRIYSARMYVLPDNQVKIIRKAQKL